MSDNPTASTPPAPHSPPTPPAPLTPENERLWSTLLHLGWLAGGVVGLPFLPAIIGYLLLKDRGAFVRRHTAAALNFQLSWLIWGVGLTVVAILTLGLGALLVIPFGIAYVVLTIIDAVRANRGEAPLMALSIRFVR